MAFAAVLPGVPFLAISATEWASLAVAVVAFVSLTVAAGHALRLNTRALHLEWEIEDLKQQLAASQQAEIPPSVTLDREWEKLRARNHRHGEEFSLVILDVGDALRPSATLRAAIATTVNRALESARRTEDFLYHLDARTFVALLAGCDAAGAGAFIDRVRSRLSNEPVRDEDGTTYISITAGVAPWDPKYESLSEMIDAARADRETFNDRLKRQLADEFEGAGGGGGIDSPPLIK